MITKIKEGICLYVNNQQHQGDREIRLWQFGKAVVDMWKIKKNKYIGVTICRVKYIYLTSIKSNTHMKSNKFCMN